MHFIWPWQEHDRSFSSLKACVFLLLFGPALWLGYSAQSGAFGFAPLGELTFWSGIWAMALLLLALGVTPTATIFRLPRLFVVRRMIGVSALAYSLAHIVIYCALRFWDFNVIAHEIVTSVSLIAALATTLGLIALGATSFDAAVRRMGAGAWNRLHGMIYVLAGLALLHFLIVPEPYPQQYEAGGIFLWLMAWRWLNRHGRAAGAWQPAQLAIVSALFTAALEAGWTWAYYGYAPLDTLSANFSLVFGVSPAVKILTLGLLVAIAAYVRRKALQGAA